MELKYYLDKAIDEYLGKMGTITSKKIMNYVYSEYNIDANMEEISNILKERASILEIVDGIFVDKNSFLSFVKETDMHLLKSQIEFQYFVSINEGQMVEILDMVKSYKNKKLNLYTIDEFENTDKTTIENEVEKQNEIKWTYSKILDFGMEYGYINSSWVQNIDYSLEKEVQDYFETIEEIEEKGIKIKY